MYAKPNTTSSGTLKTVGGALGGIIGALAAAPTGGMSVPMGMGLGSSIGGLLGGMAGGGNPGQELVSGAGQSVDEILAEIVRQRRAR